MENLEGTDKFLDVYNLPRQYPEEIESLNRPVTNKKIESLTKSPSPKSELDDVTGEL